LGFVYKDRCLGNLPKFFLEKCSTLFYSIFHFHVLHLIIPSAFPIIVKIDSITRSLGLCQNVQNGLSYPGEETRPKLCINGTKLCLASALLEQIKISCYTECKAFGPSLIYNTILSHYYECTAIMS